MTEMCVDCLMIVVSITPVNGHSSHKHPDIYPSFNHRIIIVRNKINITSSPKQVDKQQVDKASFQGQN